MFWKVQSDCPMQSVECQPVSWPLVPVVPILSLRLVRLFALFVCLFSIPEHRELAWDRRRFGGL